jgi:choline kinase
LKAIILGAGSGSRLGKQVPKPLVYVSKGCTILDVQLAFLTQFLSTDDILVVVGFRKELIERRYPHLRYAYNDQYATTNTAASLFVGLQETGEEDVLWLNGDIVLDSNVLSLLERYTAHNLVWVNMNRVGEEEVKYTLDNEGYIKEISKSIKNALGEAVGINLIKREDVAVLRSCLDRCNRADYFERALQFAIERGVKLVPVDVEDRFCVEVDYQEDLERVQSFVQQHWRL